jgi:hypothetical protein
MRDTWVPLFRTAQRIYVVETVTGLAKRPAHWDARNKQWLDAHGARVDKNDFVLIEALQLNAYELRDFPVSGTRP